jgi:DNA-directed RNA polymerase subunit RPC12/RpoP
MKMGLYNMVGLNYECPNCGEQLSFIEQIKNDAHLCMKTFYLGDKVWGMKEDDKWSYDLKCDKCNKKHKLYLYFNFGRFAKAAVVDSMGNVTRYKRDLKFENVSAEDLKDIKLAIDDIQKQLGAKRIERMNLDTEINKLEAVLTKLKSKANRALGEKTNFI